MEKFVAYWQKMVTSNYDMVTGIATAQVRAFTPDDALLIANSLVQLSEALVNKIANRSNVDAVRFAEAEVLRAQERLKIVRANLTQYRNKVGVIDPATSVVASNSTVQQTLQASLATLETQLTSLLGRNLAPTSPAVQTLQNQIKATKDQIAAMGATVGTGKDRADGAALSSVVAEYEQLELERGFAQALVTTAMQALEQARANAAAQHLYITPYVRPSLPESSVYPRRLFSIIVVGLIAFGIWVVALLTVRSIRERFG
jgi:capsular polysaccharide transport system permease protein